MDGSYKYKNYPSDIVKGLDWLRKDGISRDGLLKTMDGNIFPVHRNVLMAVSPYFKAMFSSGFVEAVNNPEEPITLPTISAVGLCPACSSHGAVNKHCGVM